MPRLDGFSAAARLRADPDTATHPDRDGHGPCAGLRPLAGARARRRRLRDQAVRARGSLVERRPLRGERREAAPTASIRWIGDPGAALRLDRRRPDLPRATAATITLPGGAPSEVQRRTAEGQGARRLRHQHRAAAGQEEPASPPREFAELLATELASRRRRSPPSTSPARVSSTSRSAPAAQGEVARDIVARRVGVRLVRRSDAARADQPRVRLGQPDRPDPHRRSALGGRSATAWPGSSRRSAPTWRASTTSTTTAPRSTASRGRLLAVARGRAASPRTATSAPTSPRSPSRSSTANPDVLTLPDDEAQEMLPARRRRADVHRDQADRCTASVSTSTSTSTSSRCTTAARSSGRSTRLTEMGNTYEADGALWLRTEQFGDDKDRVIVRSNGDAGLHLRRLRLLPRQARARLRPVRDHARRRPPRLCRPADGDVPGVRRQAAREPRGADRPDGQPGPGRASRCGWRSVPAT